MTGSKIFLFLVLPWLMLVNDSPSQEPINGETQFLRTRAIKIHVTDMNMAVAFYVSKLGFEIAAGNRSEEEITLRTEDRVKLILVKVKQLRQTADTDTRAAFSLQVNDLNDAVYRMRKAGIEIVESEPRKEGVGFSIHIRDPFGRLISLLHQTIVKVEPFKEPRIYNFGFYVPDMDVARNFYERELGFTVRSEKYLPRDLPLGHADNSFGFMLHKGQGVHSVKSSFLDKMPFNVIVFETVDLRLTVEELRKRSIKIASIKENGAKRIESIIFEDPFGNISEIIEVEK